ncbi:MAG: exopolysaccharide biosynthesis protein [Mizugakiibacter sp.]|uniref:exopolysaccharide biosynthesis protein n=1 Tax=Mizugakiibacter sp. TaxID=1972610 RepID=UPI0031C8377E|nr:exopolysaccharide biosynthesis protein [Xanthomonadaceae bacterium]
MMSPADRRTTELLVETVAAHPEDTIGFDALLEPLRARAFGFLLLLLAIPNFIPVPIGIGGVMGALVAFAGVQMLVGLERPWLPAWLLRKRFARTSVLRFLERIAPVMRRIERICQPRLEALTQRPATLFSGLLLVLLGMLLALPIPFTNYLFGSLLLAFGIVLTERDGALLLGIWAASIALIVSAALLSGNILRLLGHLL